ncbi:hypothetical protein BGZ94_005597 [Podila epigama]|nr:hypothetical protein BGZ94_005597 [Podila epigama]
MKGLPLPLLLKNSELAVADLKVLVQYSSLPTQSKDLLVEQLGLFHNRAKVAGRKLQFLQARANGCLDGLAIRNMYLTVELDRLEEEQRLLIAQQGTFWGKAWNVLSGAHDLQVAVSKDKIVRLYQLTMSEARDHVRDLIIQAQDILQSLDALDVILRLIHEITVLETKLQHQDHAHTLASLWWFLGANRVEKQLYQDNLEVLREIGGQRKATVGQIQTAIWKLTDFEAEIGILREKLVGAALDAQSNDSGAPVIGGNDDNDVGADGATLRAHIQQIDMVTSRLKGRSFLTEARLKEQADKIHSSMSDPAPL